MSERTVAGIRSPAAEDLRPYPPSWIHRIDDALRPLPGPTWLAYVAIGLLVGVQTQVQAWENGDAASWTFHPPSLYWTFLAAVLPWSAHYFRRIAGDAFDAFRPVLALPDDEAERLRYELAVIPAAASWIGLVVSTVVTVGGFVLAPADSGILGVSPATVVAAALVQVPLVSILFAVAIQLLRQMRSVGRAMAAAQVDLFHQGPLDALTRLTARGGIALVLIVAPSVVFVEVPSDIGAFIMSTAPYVVLPPVMAVIAFIVPLTGMHARLDREKDRLLGEADARLQRVLAEINRDVDALDLARADGLNRTLASLVQEREILARLPTWPWSTATIRGFVTAILLPLGLFVAQQVLSRFV